MKRKVEVLISLFISQCTAAQQFNTDSYLAMPHGVGTFVLTAGQRNATYNNSFSLLPKWEFFTQALVYWEDKANETPQYFTLSVYAKYMFKENQDKTGGAAIFIGLGRTPAYYRSREIRNFQRTIWTAFPITLPLFRNTISWDIMPGATLNFDDGNNRGAFGFTYTARVAVYKVIPKVAIVGEIFGTVGAAYSKPEFKTGLRWEPNSTIIPAITYGAALDGTKTSGLEIGVMIFTPPFLKRPQP
ncbi:MAG: hypothetical protein KIT80_02050 [Chitinophagaceae bacterium]|nr:hypothetical protein [Chitinophagaceae bacterium]MCW5925667.1 hypothetical protein [Chitinophagaceae bacterium]